jgi:murein DD-endopeptidase MepM/ murein hydrolase activator NlpD
VAYRTGNEEEMRTPLDKMQLRAADIEESIHQPGVTSKLSWQASPVGGSFGKVRSSGHKPHQGWDLYATVGTPVYAVMDGQVAYAESHGDYGLQVCILLGGLQCSNVDAIAQRFHSAHLYAFYGHLSSALVKKGDTVREGQTIGLSGNSGNARTTPPHLHFEVRTVARLGKGLVGRIDPGELLGYQYYSCSL